MAYVVQHPDDVAHLHVVVGIAVRNETFAKVGGSEQVLLRVGVKLVPERLYAVVQRLANLYLTR